MVESRLNEREGAAVRCREGEETSRSDQKTARRTQQRDQNKQVFFLINVSSEEVFLDVYLVTVQYAYASTGFKIMELLKVRVSEGTAVEKKLLCKNTQYLCSTSGLNIT